MSHTPTSLRIPKKLRARLTRAALKSNTPASEIILAGLERFLAEHNTTPLLIDAIIRQRQEQAQGAE